MLSGKSSLYEDLICHGNGSENIITNGTDRHQLAELKVLIPGVVVFFLTYPFILFHFRLLPIGTTPAIIAGALLMVSMQVVSQEEAYHVMGHRDHLTAIFLLLGIMLLAQYVEREQILVKILRRLLFQHQSFPNYIWRICMLSFLISALFTNDACCAIFTPLVLKFWETQERPRTELEPILIAIATSANIGSVITAFGNPQIAFIAAKTSRPEFAGSRLDMLTCIIYLLPPAIIIGTLNTIFVILYYKLRTRQIEKTKLISEASQSEQEMAGLAGHTNGLNNPSLSTYECFTSFSQDRLAMPTSLETIKEDEVLEIPENRGIDIEAQERELVLHSSSDSDSDNEPETPKNTSEDLTQISAISYKPSQLTQSFEEQRHNDRATETSLNRILDGSGLQISHRAGVYKSVSSVSASDFFPVDTGLNQLSPSESLMDLFSPGDSHVFPCVVLVLLVAVIALLLASTDALKFDLGLVPMGAAALALVADAILNRRSGLFVIKRVDWSIIIMFLALFVYIQGFENTQVPRFLWTTFGLHDARFGAVAQIAILCCVVLVGSNLFSNVPLVLILLNQLEPCVNQRALVIILAWVSTISGNLTLYGSAANLIVVQKGVQALKYRLTYGQYFLFCFPTTIFHTLLGVLIISGFLLIPV